jgi:hypothetical protein
MRCVIERMGNCNCCWKNDGEVRKWRTIVVSTSQGDIRKRVEDTRLCDACNDDRFPYYREDASGTQTLTCPHEVG